MNVSEVRGKTQDAVYLDDAAFVNCPESIQQLAGVGWEECTREEAERVLWRKSGSWMGPMPLSDCIWPDDAQYLFVRKKDDEEAETS